MSIPTSDLKRYVLLCVVAATILIASAAIVGSANSPVALSISDSTSVPAETVEFEGQSYEITAIAVRDADEEFTVRVSLPDEEFTTVDFLIYNSDQQIEASTGFNRPSTTEQTTFQAGSFSPGTYMLNVELEGATEQVQPIVITGYDVAVNHRESASRDENITITADVSPDRLSSPPAAVEVAIWDGSNSQTFTMSRSGDETYTTSIPLEQFQTGEYTVNVAALGDTTVRGQQEVFALESSSITIHESSSDDHTGHSNSGTETSSTENESSSETESTENESSSGTDTTTNDTAEVETNESDGSGVSDTDSDNNVIEPTDDDSSEDSDDQVSLFAVQLVLLFSILVASIHHLRH